MVCSTSHHQAALQDIFVWLQSNKKARDRNRTLNLLDVWAKDWNIFDLFCCDVISVINLGWDRVRELLSCAGACARVGWLLSYYACSICSWIHEEKNTLKCALWVLLKGESHDRADDDGWWRNFRMSRAVCAAVSDTRRVRLRLWRQTRLTFIWSSSERAGPIPPESPFSHTRVSLSSGSGHAHAGERTWVAMATNRRWRSENCSENKYRPSKHQF